MVRGIALALMMVGTASAQDAPTVRYGGPFPEHPQRVVSLFGPLLTTPLYELGVPVVGSSYNSDAEGGVFGLKELFGVNAEDVDIVEISALDPEGIQALRPDAIIGLNGFAEGADRLALIAPTLLLGHGVGGIDGLATSETLADMFGAQDPYAKLRSDYEERVRRVRGALPSDFREGTFAALWVIGDVVSVLGTVSPIQDVMADLGMRPPDWMEEEIFRSLDVPISPEVLQEIDADLLLIVGDTALIARSPTAIDATLEDILPGWKRFLPAARDGRVIYLDGGVVLTNTFASAHRVMDSLEADFLLETGASEE